MSEIVLWIEDLEDAAFCPQVMGNYTYLLPTVDPLIFGVCFSSPFFLLAKLRYRNAKALTIDLVYYFTHSGYSVVRCLETEDGALLSWALLSPCVPSLISFCELSWCAHSPSY